MAFEDFIRGYGELCQRDEGTEACHDMVGTIIGFRSMSEDVLDLLIICEYHDATEHQ